MFSGSEVDSRPALLESSFWQNGELRTVDASVASRVGSHGNLDTVFALLLRSFFTLCQTQVGCGGLVDPEVGGGVFLFGVPNN